MAEEVCQKGSSMKKTLGIVLALVMSAMMFLGISAEYAYAEDTDYTTNYDEGDYESKLEKYGHYAGISLQDQGGDEEEEDDYESKLEKYGHYAGISLQNQGINDEEENNVIDNNETSKREELISFYKKICREKINKFLELALRFSVNPLG